MLALTRYACASPIPAASPASATRTPLFPVRVRHWQRTCCRVGWDEDFLGQCEPCLGKRHRSVLGYQPRQSQGKISQFKNLVSGKGENNTADENSNKRMPEGKDSQPRQDRTVRSGCSPQSWAPCVWRETLLSASISAEGTGVTGANSVLSAVHTFDAGACPVFHGIQILQV